MKRILYVLFHTSTGGMPQYSLKQIEQYKNEFEIAVVEVNNYGDSFIVQRERIKKLVPFFQCNGDQNLLFKYIEDFNPDILSIQEVPESFLNRETLNKLYNKDRKYNIVVTSHSSLTRRKNFTYIPDRLIAVNKWQKELFEKEFPDTQVDMWEYPIEDKKVSTFYKIAAQYELGGDIENAKYYRSYVGPDVGGIRKDSVRYQKWLKWEKHVLNVGLFTPGKNQGELFEIARQNPQNKYHFVGNQAENFRDYWGPLMKNKPDNCIIWGERDDLELFYQAANEFYFPSLQELCPLVVKEALSYGLPVTMRRLPSYGSDYDLNPLVTYIK